ncbi:hypothetical protein RO3G_02116 [Rhizopus delemar RA 99-880]|uniref:Uncharacterized protein n=1 Tax=Rhizopus delemar (strain RA 99-880 / ATCC MYA-4621 / FGSC 9543 / NRRL 43880) TaxID=246409 RepID=I1BMI2_RHIO9|nr:hypothetical protein RO3G_02116 [Rhizopus delemar RA 99-880]|eukprot:EIE77412.1 hypothetical protein RO3G_02116 [Rhizopus delemar RA 99-880]
MHTKVTNCCYCCHYWPVLFLLTGSNPELRIGWTSACTFMDDDPAIEKRSSKMDSLNNHLLQQSHLDECFLDVSITSFADIYLLTTFDKLLSSSSINIFQYLFVQEMLPEDANEPLTSIPVCRRNGI